MSDILYTYQNQVYANITNKCDCSCLFCIRSHENAIGEAETLWHEQEPSLNEVKAAMAHFDFSKYSELVYCGYGEPTCALDVLLESAKYAKETYDLSIRVNTNGLANLYHGQNVIPRLAEAVDSLSISLNAPTREQYNAVTRPQFDHAFEAMLDFAREAQKQIKTVRLSIVDVLSPEDIEACRQLAASLSIPLKVRKYA